MGMIKNLTILLINNDLIYQFLSNQNVKENGMSEKRKDSENEKKNVKENGNYRKKSANDKKRRQKPQKLSLSQVLKIVIKLLKTQILKHRLLIIQKIKTD